MENIPVNFREIRFNRDTKVNYKDGNPIINTIFNKYDKDNSGDFNEQEWNAYQQQLKSLEERKAEIDKLRQNANDDVVSHYSRNIQHLNKKIEKLRNDELELIKQNDFEKLIEFERTHNVSREGYINESELPDGAKKYDISTFKMGIYNEQEGYFTGECYTKGYLSGFENLTDEEKNEYLKLLNNTVDTNKQIRKFEERISALNKELDKNLALEDLAQNGMVNKVGTSEYENNVYMQYSAIRNESNPFYGQIKELESKYTQLKLKGNPTQDETRLMEQYRIQINQLEQASKEWSISDANRDIQENNGFRLTNVSEQIMYKQQSNSFNGTESETNTITDNHTIGAIYKDQNWNLNANFTKGETYTLNSDEDTVHTYNAYLGASFGRENLSVTSNSSINADDSSIYYSQSLEGKYKNLSLRVDNNLNVTKFEMPDENGNTIENRIKSNSTNIEISYQTGKFTNTAAVGFEEEGTTVSAGSRANFGIQAGKSFLSINPSSNFTYNTGAETYTVNPAISANYSFNSKNLRANVMLNNNLSITAAPSMDTQLNNNFNLNAGLTYKDFSFTGKYNNSYSKYSTTNTFGAEAAYNNKNAGRFAIEYSRQNSKSDTYFTGTDQVMFTYSAPIDTITNWFKKK